MKLLALILGLSLLGMVPVAKAQPPSITVILPGPPPGGLGAACTLPTLAYYNPATSILATCVAGVWTALGSGGGSGGNASLIACTAVNWTGSVTVNWATAGPAGVPCNFLVATLTGNTTVTAMSNGPSFMVIQIVMNATPRTLAYDAALGPALGFCAASTTANSVTDQLVTFDGTTYNGAGCPASTDPSQVTFSCQPGLGDGQNAIAAATYTIDGCLNTFGSAYTITGIRCLTDNAGTSTLAPTNSTGTALLTGAVTCTATFPGAAGTQSATTTIANNGGIIFVFVADGTSKRATFAVTVTRIP